MHNLTQDYPTIAEAIRTALYDDFAEPLDEYGLFEPERISEVSSVCLPGFIPFTNGGFDAMVMQFLGDSYDATGRECEIIEPFYISAGNDAAAEFVRHRADDTQGPGPDLAKAYKTAELPEHGGEGSYDFVYQWFEERETAYRNEKQTDLVGDRPKFWQTPAGCLKEAFIDYCNEWVNESGEYWLQARTLFYASDNSRNETGQDEIYFCAGINTDFSYGREAGLQETFSKTYKLSRLTPARVRVIVEAMRKSITDKPKD